MSDEEPNKIVEPSPFEKWWAEVQEWRAGREKRQVVKRRDKAEHFNETRHLRSKQRSRATKKSVIDFFGILGMLLFGLINMVFGLIGAIFRMGFWIAIVAGLIWILTTVDVEEGAKDEKVDAVKEQTGKAKEKIKDGVGDVIQSLSDEIDKVKKRWHIEIRTHDEEGEEVIMEFGTKKEESSDE